MAATIEDAIRDALQARRVNKAELLARARAKIQMIREVTAEKVRTQRELISEKDSKKQVAHHE